MTTSTHRFGALPVNGVPLHSWLLDRLSLYLQRPAVAIDATVPLAEYGLDSVCALSLCGDLEDQFGLAVDQTLLWDHPTVESLLGFLETEIPKVPAERR